MGREINQDILMLGFLVDQFFEIPPTPDLDSALTEDMRSMFSGAEGNGSAHVYFGKLQSLKVHVSELLIVQAHQSGKTVASISRDFGTSVQYIYRAFNKHNYKPKRQKRFSDGFAFYHRVFECELIKLMNNDGIPIKLIASKQNITESTVREILKGN